MGQRNSDTSHTGSRTTIRIPGGKSSSFRAASEGRQFHTSTKQHFIGEHFHIPPQAGSSTSRAGAKRNEVSDTESTRHQAKRRKLAAYVLVDPHRPRRRPPGIRHLSLRPPHGSEDGSRGGTDSESLVDQEEEEEGFGEDVLGMNGLPALTDSEAEEENRVNALLVGSPSPAVALNGDLDYGSQPTPPRLNDYDKDTIAYLGVEPNSPPVRRPDVGPARQHTRRSSPVSILVFSIARP